MDRANIIQYFRHVWDDARVACAIISVEMQVEEVNQFFAEQLEYTTAQMEGMHVDSFTAEEFRGQGVAEINRVFRGELVSFVQHKEYESRSGKKLPALASSFPIYRGEQIDHFFSVVLFDVCDSDLLTRLAVAEAQASAFRGVVESMAGNGNKTTVNVDAGNTSTTNSGNTSTTNSGNTSTTNSGKWMIAMGVMVLLAMIGVAVVVVGGSLSATDGKNTIEVEADK